MIRLICCDVDRTLLTGKDGALPSALFETVNRLTERGVLFAAVSGRPAYDLFSFFGPVADRILLAAFDGAAVFYRNRLLSERPIERNLYRAFLDSLQSGQEVCAPGQDAEYILYTLTDAYVGSLSGAAAAGLKDARTLEGRLKRLSDPDAFLQPVYKLSLYSPRPDTDFTFAARPWLPYLNLIYAGGHWCDFVSKDTEKGLAVQLLMEQFGISRAEAMAFGDGVNDIGMLRACDFSFAMENAPEDVKNAARYVTGDVLRTVASLLRL